MLYHSFVDKPTNLTRRSILQGLGASITPALLAQQSRTRNPVRIGIVGGRFGSSFQWHLHPNAKVTAVCDIRPDALQRLSEVYRCNSTYKTFAKC